jgi:chromosome segregation ATPase
LEQLQLELAERDARLAELTENHAEPLDSVDVESSDLLARLDELLDELTRADERASELERLLEAAEEACRAEREERRQLEAWVEDIERRVGQREADFQADNQLLRNRLEEARAEQGKLEEQLRNVVHASGSESARQAVAEMQQRCKELQGQLETLAAEKASLQARLAERQAMQSEGWQQSQLEEALREERIRLAQQQAELARRRAEMATAQAQLESPGHGGRSEIDQRVKAFREHLREIHSLEQRERTERGLAARLGKLWKRLES